MVCSVLYILEVLIGFIDVLENFYVKGMRELIIGMIYVVNIYSKM